LSFVFVSCQKDETAPPQTPPKESVKPVVATDSTILITDSSGRIRGRIISNGSDTIQLAGMEWKKSSEPESGYNRLIADSAVFSFDIKNLQPGTQYQTRAFASTAAGTSYGTVLTFQTDTIPAVVCPATVTDIDGNVYQVVRIGSQCWMKENLRCTKFRNGTSLKDNLDAGTWSTIQAGSYSSYADVAANGTAYGYLYNQYSVLDAGKICPVGWHVPTDADWSELEVSLGGASVAGGKLKSTGILPNGLWQSPNTGASNSSGFSALPGGQRNPSGEYLEIGQSGYWWCTGTQNNVKPRSLSSSSAASVSVSAVNRAAGYSIRCVAD
jgi:uncharacterized protein (TIGR02145 family)